MVLLCNLLFLWEPIHNFLLDVRTYVQADVALFANTYKKSEDPLTKKALAKYCYLPLPNPHYLYAFRAKPTRGLSRFTHHIAISITANHSKMLI